MTRLVTLSNVPHPSLYEHLLCVLLLPRHLDSLHGGTLYSTAVVRSTVSPLHRHVVYMDGLQDHFLSHTPVQSFSSLFHCCAWVWFHQLLCNVSNQARSRDEDKVNRPWRPLPSGRITEPQAVALRWSTVVFCMFLSSIYDQDLVLTTMGLVATTFTYDELGAAGNVVGKALCTAAGYVAFEVGATTIIGANHTMDFVSVTAVTISGILIFTAIQAQDFPDVEGDKAVGRMTFPIYAPELSRLLTLLATVAWSVFLSWFWGVGPLSTAVFISFGIHVGLRYYCWRTLKADKKSYLLFNVWLMAAHVLPLHARTSVLAL